MLALVERQEDRGLVVAQGGGKVSVFFISPVDFQNENISRHSFNVRYRSNVSDW